jgi:hypothetical protein
MNQGDPLHLRREEGRETGVRREAMRSAVSRDVVVVYTQVRRRGEDTRRRSGGGGGEGGTSRSLVAGLFSYLLRCGVR